MVKAMACGIVVSEFVLQSRYYVHFQATLRQVLTRERAGGCRCHSVVTIVRDETGDGVRVTSRTGSAQRFVEN